MWHEFLAASGTNVCPGHMPSREHVCVIRRKSHQTSQQSQQSRPAGQHNMLCNKHCLWQQTFGMLDTQPSAGCATKQQCNIVLPTLYCQPCSAKPILPNMSHQLVPAISLIPYCLSFCLLSFMHPTGKLPRGQLGCSNHRRWLQVGPSRPAYHRGQRASAVAHVPQRSLLGAAQRRCAAAVRAFQAGCGAASQAAGQATGESVAAATQVLVSVLLQHLATLGPAPTEPAAGPRSATAPAAVSAAPALAAVLAPAELAGQLGNSH